jgi:Protein of Unknown function (DUF2784)
MWLSFLNIFFFCFHTAFIFFNVFGWMWPRLRRWNLYTLLMTAFSWFVLGIWYGWGYCFCTDWHWTVRRQLGFKDESNSYIHFLIVQLTGADIPAQVVDYVTAIVFFISLSISVFINSGSNIKQ